MKMNDFANRYKIESELELNKLSKQFVAYDHTDKKHVIIEIFDSAQLQDTQTLNNLKNEISISKKLKSRYFMNYINSFELENKFYVVWDYIDVAKIIDNKSLVNLSHRDMYLFISKLLKAIAIAHNSGVIHGTLSSESILITPSLEPIIVGFLTPGVLASTDPGFTRGPNAYTCAAPELFEGTPIDESCDYYSIGVIAKFLLNQIDMKTKTSRKSNTAPVEIQRAESLVNALTSLSREERLKSAELLIDESFLHSLSTPAGGIEKIKISKRKARKIRRSLKPSKPRNDRTLILIAVLIKASIAIAVALLILLVFSLIIGKN
ncbi:MAG: hypothetical protein U0R17_07780 [Acidimicrobiia bacterium]